MIETVKGGRLYFPPEDENKPDDRKVMHPETDSAQVVMGNGKTLEETMKSGRLIVSDEQPTDPCIWGKPGETFTVEE